MKKGHFEYIQVPRGVYVIWGHYIMGNDTFNHFLTLSNVSEPWKHFKTQISEHIFFVHKKCLKMAKISSFFHTKKLILEILVLGCSYGSNTLEKVKTMLEVPFPMI